jgi:16S rRNA (guanine966-N2)-methyltransferase
LVEPDKKALNCLRKNIEKFYDRFPQETKERKIELIPTIFEKFLSKFKNEYSTWTEEDQKDCILFFDPPYSSHDFYKKIILIDVKKNNWYKGFIWVESDEKKGIPFSAWETEDIEITKIYAHGHSYIFMAKF